MTTKIRTLRSELEAWATRNEPWTGPSNMTAEDGYNAAIEEVAVLLNDPSLQEAEAAARYNRSLDEALNSGEGTYKP